MQVKLFLCNTVSILTSSQLFPVMVQVTGLISINAKVFAEMEERTQAIEKCVTEQPTKQCQYGLYLSVSMTFSCLSPTLVVQAMSARRGSAPASFVQHYADLSIHQQSYNEGNIEGSYRWVHHEGWVSKAACGTFTAV